MARVVLDSSILIALFSSTDPHHQATMKALSTKNEYLISAITLTEALISPYRRSEADGKSMHGAITKSVNQVVEINSEIANSAAMQRAKFNLSLPDAIISSTATKTRSQLWTCDRALAKAHKNAVLIA